LKLQLIKVRTNNSKGYSLLISGGVMDICYMGSKTRRGRVQGGGMICPTITATDFNVVQVIRETERDDEMGLKFRYRVRKLTPLETWRLQNFSDEDFHKAEEVCSNTRLYEQSGNSITENCLVAIFGQMLPGKEDFYKERIK